MYLERWHDHYTMTPSQLIAAAYAGHIDSRINDQYRTPPGRGAFCTTSCSIRAAARSTARLPTPRSNASTGTVVGVSLTSIVAPDDRPRHTDLRQRPTVRGTGIGHELLRQSLTTLRDMGCHSASLTVTTANEDAVSLYERVGFQTIRRFSAYVWEGF